MPGNTFGQLFRLTSFGESHGPAVGGVIDGCPAGLELDFNFIGDELARRNLEYPGSTPRKEQDESEWLSGLSGNVTLGTPLAFLIRNKGQRSGDYDELSGLYRPSHADYSYEVKYGIRDHRGGGRASGRETAVRVVAGAVAKTFLKTFNMHVESAVVQIGPIRLAECIEEIDYNKVHNNYMRLADPLGEKEVLQLLHETQSAGDTLGGAIACRIKGVPPGLGDPVFGKLQTDLAKAMMCLGTAKAFEYGLGFRAAGMSGSAYNDQMKTECGRISFLTNHDGGIQGGISNGEEIYFQVGFKPVPSIHKPQQMVGIEGQSELITIGGRHDTCHVPRLVVVVEAMAALVMADHVLLHRSSKVSFDRSRD